MAKLRDFLVYPSFYSLILTGLILLFVFILFFKNFKSIMAIDSYRIISLLCVIAIAIGNHGILHALFETKGQKPNFDLTTLF